MYMLLSGRGTRLNTQMRSYEFITVMLMKVPAFLGYDAVQFGVYVKTIWMNTPCSFVYT